MPIYRTGDEPLAKFVCGVLEEYHKDLANVGVTIDVMEARAKTDQNGEPVEEALKLHGYPCLATIKVRGPKDRGEGRGDALLTIDADRWDELDQPEQTALIDHELTHLQLVFGEEGLKRDDYGRPKLKIRLHDHQFGWFDEVAVRHPISSQEVQQAKQFVDEHGQIYLVGMEEEGAKQVSKREPTVE